MVPGLTDSMTPLTFLTPHARVSMSPVGGWISKEITFEITIESELDCKDIEYKYLISQKGGVVCNHTAPNGVEIG